MCGDGSIWEDGDASQLVWKCFIWKSKFFCIYFGTFCVWYVIGLVRFGHSRLLKGKSTIFCTFWKRVLGKKREKISLRSRHRVLGSQSGEFACLLPIQICFPPISPFYFIFYFASQLVWQCFIWKSKFFCIYFGTFCAICCWIDKIWACSPS